MLRHSHPNVLFAALLLVIPLTAGVPSDSHAGGFEGPPVDNATEHLTGAAVMGTLTITPAAGGINVLFAGRCRQNQDVVVGPSFLDIAFDPTNITPDSIKSFGVGNISNFSELAGCYPPHVTDGRLIIIAVTRFTMDPSMATADVVILAAVPK